MASLSGLGQALFFWRELKLWDWDSGRGFSVVRWEDSGGYVLLECHVVQCISHLVHDFSHRCAWRGVDEDDVIYSATVGCATCVDVVGVWAWRRLEVD